MHTNLREINSLNQRGGRMLSVIDLIADGTLDAAGAGYLLAEVSRGASFLCAAGPGGVGKTTLMACLLSFLPPTERIVTVTSPQDVRAPDGAECYLCHEIGAGGYFGYMWGDDAAEFFSLGARGRIAATLHADSVTELSRQLLGPDNRVSPTDLAAIGLLAFMVREDDRRRVSSVHGADPGDEPSFTEVIGWRRDTDNFHVRPLGDSLVARATDLIQNLVDADARQLEEVMAAVAGFHAASP